MLYKQRLKTSCQFLLGFCSLSLPVLASIQIQDSDLLEELSAIEALLSQSPAETDTSSDDTINSVDTDSESTSTDEDTPYWKTQPAPKQSIQPATPPAPRQPLTPAPLPPKPAPVKPVMPKAQPPKKTAPQPAVNYRNFTHILRPVAPTTQIGLQIEGSINYWKAYVPSLVYCTSPDGAPTSFATYGEGNLRHPQYSFEPGFQLKLGYSDPSRNYNLYFQYTYLRSTATSSAQNLPATTTATFFLPSYYLSNQTGNTNIRATSQAKLSYDAYDLMGQTKWLLTNHNQLNIQFGAELARLRQNWQSAFFTATATSIAPQYNQGLTTQFNVNYDWQWHGAGPLGGISWDYRLINGFGLHILASGGVLVGQFKEHFRIFGEDNAGIIGYTNITESRFIPTIKILAGLGYKYMLRTISFGFYVDYEARSYFGAHQNIEVLGPLTTYVTPFPVHMKRSNVSMQGVTAGITLEF